MIQVLDHGYVSLVNSWGSDQLIIESARMSTDGAFKGWGDGGAHCTKCEEKWAPHEVIPCELMTPKTTHRDCGGEIASNAGDEKLLAYLYKNKHMTPFEMCGLTIEVSAPLFVFREWHRHRTQSYSEMSARYVPLPNENYMPRIERITDGAQGAGNNRQAQGAYPLADEEDIWGWMMDLAHAYDMCEKVYQSGIEKGIPKEIARLIVPVGRYSRMRATANLRNHLAFLELRQAPNAQYEIRMYANAVATLLEQAFPRTMELFNAR